MAKPLDVPWKEIRTIVEKGTTLKDAAALFGCSPDAIRTRSNREKWDTPKRRSDALKQASGVHGRRVAENASVAAQLTEAESAPNLAASASIDLETLSKEYQGKAARKLFTLINSSVILPPRNWKDLDIADKMMRRTLGLDDTEGKITSVVQLQVVNDRLRDTLSTQILEGELVTESVREVSEGDLQQSRLTGSESAPPTTQPPHPSIVRDGDNIMGDPGVGYGDRGAEPLNL